MKRAKDIVYSILTYVTRIDSNKNGKEADDIPMVNFASFALYKLFSEWETAGYFIPDMHPPTTADATTADDPKTPPKPTVRTELPSNYEQMHPATLLCIVINLN